MDNMAAGAQHLVETLKKGGNIFTIADGDVDGATSFAIIYQYMHDICDQVNLDWEIHTGKQHGLSDFIGMIEDSDKAYDLVLITDAGSNDYEYIDGSPQFSITVDAENQEFGTYLWLNMPKNSTPQFQLQSEIAKKYTAQ